MAREPSKASGCSEAGSSPCGVLSAQPPAAFYVAAAAPMHGSQPIVQLGLLRLLRELSMARYPQPMGFMAMMAPPVDGIMPQPCGGSTLRRSIEVCTC